MSLLRGGLKTPPTPLRDLPLLVFKEAPGAEIQSVPDVSALSASGGKGWYWRPGKSWDYKLQNTTNWGDLAGTHAPAKMVTLLKKPGTQERSWKPVQFARIDMPGGNVGYRLMWNNNWLRLVKRSRISDGDGQMLRMVSGDTPLALLLTNKTANALFGQMK